MTVLGVLRNGVCRAVGIGISQLAFHLFQGFNLLARTSAVENVELPMIYAGIGGRRKNVVYHNNVFADNAINLFLATYQLCDESLMIADTGLGLLPATQTRTVYAVYDGAGRMSNNHLVGYNGTYARFLQNIGAATKHPNHRFEGLTFDPPSPPRSVLTNYNIIAPANIGANSPGHPRIWAQVILDVDGSTSGVPNSALVSNHPFMLTGGETRPSVWTNMYRSSHRFAQWRMTYSIASDLNPNISAVRTMAGTPTAGVYYINGYKEQHQLPLIVGEDFLYTYFYETLPTSRTVNMTLGDAVAGDFVVIRYKDFGKLSGLAVSGMTSKSSLASLKSSTTSAYFKEANGDLYVRPFATTTDQSYTITWTGDITMPVVDSDGDGTSDGNEAAAGTDPFRSVNGTDPFANSEFNVANNFEQWDSIVGITNETVAGGSLAARSSNADPQMAENNLRVSGTAVPYLLVRMKASAATTAQFLWGRLGAATYTSGRVVSAGYTAANQWKVLIFPMSGQADWQNQVITNLRFDPVNTTGVDFQVDWVRASSGDLDGDGFSDASEGDGDLDQDGLVNLEDTDRDGDGIPDATDPQPDINPYDNDQDGIPDIADLDDDNDGTPDAGDAFPFNPNEQKDSDNDGIGDIADPDDDNDGFADTVDAFPFNTDESVDTDSDGIGNNADEDDDNDGVSDTNDAYPLNPAEQIDTDRDGIGNNADTDDDNDGIPDAIEIGLGLPSTVPIDPTLDSDGDGQTDLFEIHAGTGHLSSSDRFVWSVQPPAAGQPPTITMPVKAGRTYRIHSSAQLGAGEWAVVEVVQPVQDGIHVSTDSQSSDRRFYRIEVKLNP